MILRLSILALAFLILAGYEEVKPQTQNSYGGFDLVDKAGNIRRPSDYRDRYHALGTYAVVDVNGGTDMHYTYASPGTAEYYRKTGKFADGTVLVKEVFGTGHAQMTTGDAHWASGTKVWFVMIKGEKGRFPNNPLWGNGWGWALSSRMHPINRLRLTSGKTAWGVISQREQQTGFTSKVIPSCQRNEGYEEAKRRFSESF